MAWEKQIITTAFKPKDNDSTMRYWYYDRLSLHVHCCLEHARCLRRMLLHLGQFLVRWTFAAWSSGSSLLYHGHILHDLISLLWHHACGKESAYSYIERCCCCCRTSWLVAQERLNLMLLPTIYVFYDQHHHVSINAMRAQSIPFDAVNNISSFGFIK